MPFITDQELRQQLHEAVRESAAFISCPFGDDPETFNRYSDFLSGSTICFEKSRRYGIEDAYRYEIHFAPDEDGDPVFDPLFSEHNNLYHICTRAMMYEEVYFSAMHLPNMPKDFLTDLKVFAERLDVELPILMLTRISDGNEEKALEEISQLFVLSTMSNAVRICQKIMVNAMNQLNGSEDKDAHERAMYTMISCCRYLERIGIRPTVVEGCSDDGDMWYDLDKKRMRDVGAVISWYDYYVQREVSCSCPFHLPGKR